MTRQVPNRQGRIINPLPAIVFVSALLGFIFTVAYRMIKSQNFSTTMATLVESLLAVSFFIFLGVLFAYFIYVIHERIARGDRRQKRRELFGDSREEAAGKADPHAVGHEPNDKIGRKVTNE